jgi:hypothetical protein
MLARVRAAPRVTKHYGLVCKEDVRAFARYGTFRGWRSGPPSVLPLSSPLATAEATGSPDPIPDILLTTIIPDRPRAFLDNTRRERNEALAPSSSTRSRSSEVALLPGQPSVTRFWARFGTLLLS